MELVIQLQVFVLAPMDIKDQIALKHMSHVLVIAIQMELVIIKQVPVHAIQVGQDLIVALKLFKVVQDLLIQLRINNYKIFTF